uniref:SH2 domain-containing protein 4A-like n=1 Tax=Styela clava TaxID=7725 RepID=UPI0019392783|nr:SH2 domain-containing protein 4A-like [Styela clava]
MLKQIIKDMHVDPEILAELPEEQKQILFFKIREEQKRRYYESEKQFEKKMAKKSNQSEKSAKIRILEDSNGQPWTWVMGEHPNDVTVEEIWANIGNKNWVPSTRKENQAPVSKVQAIIFAKNKHSQNFATSDKKAPEIHKNDIDGKSIQPENTNNNIPKPIRPVKPKRTIPDSAKVPAKPPVSAVKPQPITPPQATSRPTAIPRANQAPKQTSFSSSPQQLKPTTSSSPSAHRTSPTASPSSARKPTPGQKPVVLSKPMKKTPVAKDSDSDEDDYENMAELADTLPKQELGDKEWETQLQRFKAADKRRSMNARRASMQIKRLSQQNIVQERKLEDVKKRFERRRSQREMKPNSRRPALPPKPTDIRPKHPAPKSGRARRPTNRSEVEEWFKETQTAEILASVDDNNAMPTWFHGMIPRVKAEALLANKNQGDFLIRISEKIWGYALSYKDECKVKHFLIDASEPNCYHFFGNDQIRHPGLEQLIAFHQDEPISYGGEILKNEIGQADPSHPDYIDLIRGPSPDVHVNKATNDTAL